MLATVLTFTAFPVTLALGPMTRSSSSTPWTVLLLALIVAPSVLMLVSVVRPRVFADPTGLLLQGPVRTTRLPWRDIERFEAQRDSWGRLTWARTVDGGRVHLPGLDGVRTASAESQAETLVGALNERLARERAQTVRPPATG